MRASPRETDALLRDATHGSFDNSAAAAAGMPLQVAVLSARLLYGAGLNCLCARLLRDANQSSSKHATDRNAVMSALAVRCQCHSPAHVSHAAVAYNATLSTGMPSLHSLHTHSPSLSVLLPVLTLFDSMAWQVGMMVMVIMTVTNIDSPYLRSDISAALRYRSNSRVRSSLHLPVVQDT